MSWKDEIRKNKIEKADPVTLSLLGLSAGYQALTANSKKQLLSQVEALIVSELKPKVTAAMKTEIDKLPKAPDLNQLTQEQSSAANAAAPPALDLENERRKKEALDKLQQKLYNPDGPIKPMLGQQPSYRQF